MNMYTEAVFTFLLKDEVPMSIMISKEFPL